MRAATARVAVLTNFVAPYRVPVLRALAGRVDDLRTLVSTPMEPGRDWGPAWDGLDVVVQRSLTLPRRWRHPGGFTERVPLHVPLDTRARLDAFEPDVVVAGELGMRTLHALRWCRRRRRALVIWATLSERTEQGRGRLRSWLRGYLLGRADGIIVNGESGARYVRRFGVPEERIHRVWQASPVGAGGGADTGAGAGMDTDTGAGAGAGTDAGAGADMDTGAGADGDADGGGGGLELLYVGRLVELKGVEGFLEGVREWSEGRGRAVRVTVVGAGPVDGRVRAFEAGGRLEVDVVGAVPFDGLEAWYGAADVLVLPTLADEWGLVVNEGMACGLPVLGSVHSQAVTELVEEGCTGWRYDPEEPGALAAALDRVAAAGREGIRRMGAAARRRVAALTPESMAERLAEVIEDALVVHRRRP